MTKVRDAMTPGVQVAQAGQSLVDVAATMRENDVGSLPVVDAGQLVGIISDRDIVMRAVAEGANPASLRAADVASRHVVTVEPDEDLEDAAKAMAEHQVRRLPVVEDGRLVGMVAQADVALMGKEKKTGEMVEQISQPSRAERT